jgi:uncharacterized protein YbjQ (UPF0145 family)
MPLALVFAVARPAGAQTLDRDQVQEVLQSNFVKDRVHKCAGRGDHEKVLRVKIEVSPAGKTAIISMAPDLGAEAVLCIKYAFETVRFPETLELLAFGTGLVNYRACCIIRITGGGADP